ncbi:MAG: dockerin type I repeat-containing protein [Planctomycetota bacterium]
MRSTDPFGRMLRVFTVLMLGVVATSPSFAVNALSFGPGQGVPGQSGVPVAVMATNDVAIHSFSLAVQYPSPADVSFTGTVDFTGTATQAALLGADPDFVAVNHDPLSSQFTVGVILELMPLNPPTAIQPSPTTAQSLVRLVFDVPSNAAPGAYALQFVNGIGNPSISNTFSNSGESSFPTLTGGTFTVLNENIFEVRDVVTAPGRDLIVPIYASHQDSYRGFQLVVSWNSTLLNLGCMSVFDPVCGCSDNCDITGRGTNADPILRSQNAHLPPGGEPWEGGVSGGFAAVSWEPGAGGGPGLRDLVTIGVVFDFTTPFEPLPVLLPATAAGAYRSILFLNFHGSATAPEGTMTEVRLEDGLGSPPKTNFAILESGVSVPVIRIDGLVTFDSSVLVFQRGDCNVDGQVNLGDVIFVLQFLFASGATPNCRDACDYNDDGLIDLSDAIYLIGYLFVNQAFPPQPFGVCGVDLTDTDTLGCMTYPQGSCP